MIDMELAWERYRRQTVLCKRRRDAVGNTIEMRMTFVEWIMVWIESGKWHLCGNKQGCYQMSRYNDIGHYEVGNVKIIERTENMRQAHKGKPKSANHKAKQSAIMLGKTHTEETKDKISASTKGIPKPKAQCVHCGTWADPGSMKRWHGDNCKRKGEH